MVSLLGLDIVSLELETSKKTNYLSSTCSIFNRIRKITTITNNLIWKGKLWQTTKQTLFHSISEILVGRNLEGSYLRVGMCLNYALIPHLISSLVSYSLVFLALTSGDYYFPLFFLAILEVGMGQYVLRFKGLGYFINLLSAHRI